MTDYRSLRIVFMGTPEFAVASLDALVKAKCNIVGVITAPDKPAGRGMKMTQSTKTPTREKYIIIEIIQPSTGMNRKINMIM